MKTYILSAVGVIFLSVIVSLVIPEGKLNKSITFVMRLVCIVVLIQPLTGIFKLGDVSSTGNFCDYEYVSSVYSTHQSEQLKLLIDEKFGISSACFVSVNYENDEFKVTEVKVEIDKNNIRLNEEIYEYLKELKYINITVYAKSN